MFGQVVQNSDEPRKNAMLCLISTAEEREKESRERKESFQRMKSGFEAVEIKESAAGGIGPKVKESAAKFTYDELKEEKERKEKEEARLKKEEFKSKHSMFEGGGSGGTNGKVDSGGEEKKKGDGGDGKKISVTS